MIPFTLDSRPALPHAACLQTVATTLKARPQHLVDMEDAPPSCLSQKYGTASQCARTFREVGMREAALSRCASRAPFPSPRDRRLPRRSRRRPRPRTGRRLGGSRCVSGKQKFTNRNRHIQRQQTINAKPIFYIDRSKTSIFKPMIPNRRFGRLHPGVETDNFAFAFECF